AICDGEGNQNIQCQTQLRGLTIRHLTRWSYRTQNRAWCPRPCTTCARAGGRGTRTRAAIGTHSLKTCLRGCCKNRRETRSLAHSGGNGSERVSESPVEFSRW